jgi:hypothetical protein
MGPEPPCCVCGKIIYAHEGRIGSAHARCTHEWWDRHITNIQQKEKVKCVKCGGEHHIFVIDEKGLCFRCGRDEDMREKKEYSLSSEHSYDPEGRLYECQDCANMDSVSLTCKEDNSATTPETASCSKHFCHRDKTCDSPTGIATPTNVLVAIPTDKLILMISTDTTIQWLLSREYRSDDRFEGYVACYHGYELHVYMSKYIDGSKKGKFGLTMFPIGNLGLEEVDDVGLVAGPIAMTFHRARSSREDLINKIIKQTSGVK